MPTAVRGSARRHALRPVVPNSAAQVVSDSLIDTLDRLDHEDPVRTAWRHWQLDGDLAARNFLVGKYMSSLVRPIAVRVHSGLPQQVELDDLMQQGYLGLVDAMERFDPERAVRFETFARPRVFGALTDYLRAIDTVPRLTRTRSKQIQGLVERFRKQFGVPPTEDELRQLLGVPEPVFRRYLQDFHPRVTVSFSGATPDGDSDESDDADAMDAFRDDTEWSPDRTAARTDLLHTICRGFDPRDRLIIILYYYEQMTMREVGVAAGISESRVSQRLESILDRLRSRLSEEWFAGQLS